MLSRSLPVKRVFSEFTVIVLGVLVALGVDAWNTDRLETRRGVEYLERLEVDVESQISLLAGSIAETEAYLAGGDSLLALINGGPGPSDPATAMFDLFGVGRYENPLADWTYREMEGAAELALIRDPSVRSVVVEYYAAAQRFDERIAESRSLLRNPAYAWMAASPISRPGGDDDFKIGDLLNQPEAEMHIQRLMTYTSHLTILRQEWTEQAEAALSVLKSR